MEVNRNALIANTISRMVNCGVENMRELASLASKRVEILAMRGISDLQTKNWDLEREKQRVMVEEAEVLRT